MTYINGKMTKGKEYEMVLNEELPSGWYGINIQDRIAILNEAIANGINLTETSLYMNCDKKKEIIIKNGDIYEKD